MATKLTPPKSCDSLVFTLLLKLWSLLIMGLRSVYIYIYIFAHAYAGSFANPCLTACNRCCRVWIWAVELFVQDLDRSDTKGD